MFWFAKHTMALIMSRDTETKRGQLIPAHLLWGVGPESNGKEKH